MFLFGVASASAATFNVNATLTDGSSITGTLSLDTTTSNSTTAVQSVSLTLGSPDSTTCGTLNFQGNAGSAGYYFNVTCANAVHLMLTLLTPANSNGYLTGYAGGNINTGSTSSFYGSSTDPVTSGTVTSAAVPPSISKAFNPAIIQVGGTSTLTITVTATTAVTGVNFTDTLPSGVVVATPNGLGGTCTGTKTAIAGSGSVSLSGQNFAGAGSCTVIATVTGTTVGSKNNSVTVGSDAGAGTAPGTASLTVVNPPQISKAFSSSVAALMVGDHTVLTFTLSNPSGNPISFTDIAFTDPLPSGLVVSTPSFAVNFCGGTLTAVPGSTSISLSGVTLAAGASCPVAVSVTGVASGLQVNTTSTVTAVGGTVVGNTATASILVGDPFQIGYAANMNIGDSVVNLTNTGTAGGFETAGNICANVYVFAEDQQLVSCCTCPLTPNHLKTLSVRNDLISNTLTPGVPIGVTVAVLATTGACNPSTPAVGTLTNGLKTFGTTIHAKPDGTYGVTETPFLPATLSATELAKLTSYCGFIQANGSGYGVCKSCREGAAGADRQ